MQPAEQSILPAAAVVAAADPVVAAVVAAAAVVSIKKITYFWSCLAKTTVYQRVQKIQNTILLYILVHFLHIYTYMYVLLIRA